MIRIPPYPEWVEQEYLYFVASALPFWKNEILPKDKNGNVILPKLDNHAMGTIFEELIRKFNEENNEEAGEHFTPRDIVNLMANLAFEPVKDKLKDGTYLIYDGACGTGGMLTLAQENFSILEKKLIKISQLVFMVKNVNQKLML